MQLGKAASIGFAMVLAVAMGFGIGWWMDKTWPSMAPWGKMVGFAIGVVAAYRNLFIMYRRLTKEELVKKQAGSGQSQGSQNREYDEEDDED